MSDTSWLNDFVNPPAIFRPVPFWSWNERMIPDEVRRQIDLMADAGWGGVMMHSRQGLITPYLGDEWFNAIDAAIEQCRKRGLNVWLYDEDKWPSGFSGGTVPLADKSYRAKALIARPKGWAATEDAEPIGQIITGLQVYVWTAPLGHDFFNGTCFTDHMSRNAMRKFLVEGYESYHDRYKDDYGQLIVAEFTDEPCTIFRRRIPVGAVPYSDDLLAAFKKMHGYNPASKFHLLFIDSHDAATFRIHYFRTINYLFETNFSKQLGNWCNERNIDLTGHYMLEGDLYGQQCWGTKVMPNYRHMGIPGIDHLGRQIAERHTAKQCQSVANQYGKNRMISEMYGCSGQGLSFEDRLWIASQQICLGVNLLNYHLSLYTMAGCRKRDFPPNIFYQQPWWPLNRVLDDSLSRTCVALSQGQYHAEMLLIHPQESMFSAWRTKVPNNDSGSLLVYDDQPTTEGVKEKLDAIQSDLKLITDTLFGHQRTFDFADETIMQEVGQVERFENRPILRINQMRYPVVILPSLITIAASTVDMLVKFIKAGGIVIRCGQRPTLLDGQHSQQLSALIDSIPEVSIADLSNYLKTHITPAVELISADDQDKRLLYTHIRDIGDGERLIYLVNLDRTRDFKCAFTFAGAFSTVHLLNTQTGEKQLLSSRNEHGNLTIDLPFARTQGHLLQLGHKSPCDIPLSLMSSGTSELIELNPSNWQVERLDDNAITLDYAYWQEGSTAFSSWPIPIIAIQEHLNVLKYDGPLSLRYPVTIHNLSSKQKVHLVLEYPQRYQLCVNGKAIEFQDIGDYLDFRWEKMDITGLLQEGENVIELKLSKFYHGDPTSYEDPVARYGTEIESIYLVGNFSVLGKLTDERPISPIWKEWDISPAESHCIEKAGLYVTDNSKITFGDSTIQGLPFYAGRLKLSTEIPEMKLHDEKVILKIEKLNAAVAQIEVDGKTVGHFISHPLELDITKQICEGGKQLSITLYSTLRNLMGPHHHADGELPAVSPWSFRPWPNLEDGSPEIPDIVRKWGSDGQRPKTWCEGYCLVSFGDIGRITIDKVRSVI